ncbi:hypothetical protein [Candidatus Lokiarchaeum ossiferum]|uniref:hypothetical protein n=1 Tax=Candidatus Lokiarchaeum ossiferum TaxID=2951803 RepID=UPI00352DCF9B
MINPPEEQEQLSPKFDYFISPWVLPNEGIMIQLQWDIDFPFTHVQIKIPSNFDVVEGINLTDFSYDAKYVIISKSQIISRNTGITFPTYFSLIVKYTQLSFDKCVHFDQFDINFYNSDVKLHTVSPIAKIFRPGLKNITPLDMITLSDDKTKYSIGINLESYGFGNISTRTSVDINSLEFAADSLIGDRVFQKMKQKCNKHEIYKQFDIQKKDIRSFTNRLKNVKKIRLDKLNFLEMFDNPKYFILAFDLAFEILIEAKITNKTETVKLNTPTIIIPKEKFNEKIVFMKVNLFYRDVLKNEYAPVEIVIPITDLRKKIGITNIDFKIEILHVEDRTFEDVEKVEVNG